MADDMLHNRSRSKTSLYGNFNDDEKARRVGVARLSANLFDKLRFELYNTLYEFAECIMFDSRVDEARAKAEADAAVQTTEKNRDPKHQEKDAALERARERRAQRKRRNGHMSDDAKIAKMGMLRRAKHERRKNMARLMKIVDPNGYLALSSCYTFGRVACSGQVAERILSDRKLCALLNTSIKRDVLMHKEELGRASQKETHVMESSGGNRGTNLGGQKQDESENEEQPSGIKFGVSTLLALPVLWDQVARNAGEEPGKQGKAAEDCILIIARLSTVPPPFNVWIRAQSGVGSLPAASVNAFGVPALENKNPSAAEAMLDDEELERQMTPPWHRWVPCATEALYHVFRQTAYTPYMHEKLN
eukprot:g1123.t1